MSFDLADTVKIKKNNLERYLVGCDLNPKYRSQICLKTCLDNSCKNYCLSSPSPTLIITSYTVSNVYPSTYKFDECDKCQSKDCCVGASDTNFIRASTILIERISYDKV